VDSVLDIIEQATEITGEQSVAVLLKFGYLSILWDGEEVSTDTDWLRIDERVLGSIVEYNSAATGPRVPSRSA